VLGLPNNCPPAETHYTSQATRDANVDLANAAWYEMLWKPVRWGLRIHDVNDNYMRGELADTVATFLQQLYNTCMTIPAQ
jgi:hypothetical protein